LRVLIITSSNPEKTSGRVAIDFMNALKIHDLEVKILTKEYGVYLDKSISYVENRFESFKKSLFTFPLRLINRILRTFNLSLRSKTDPKYCDHGFDIRKREFSTRRIVSEVSGFSPDAIIIMFMQNFLTFENLFELQEIYHVPIYIYLMDMAPMTGGCHYAWNCDGYKFNCGSCPALYSQNPSDESALNFIYKKDLLTRGDFVPIAASSWQKQQLESSSLFRHSKKGFILSPTDENLFKPVLKDVARSAFNIDQDKKVIFLGSVNYASERKGSKEASMALKHLSTLMSIEERSNVQILVTGSLKPKFEDFGFNVNFVGNLDYDSLVMAYNAATLFLNSSIEDSGPTMINQSIMCGTPVVCFEMGVAADLVINGHTGYVAKLRNTMDLAKGIFSILKLGDLEYEQYCQNCRNIAIDKCGLKATGVSFINLHRNVK
jgi:glycosyltransferase involved in cell wall biosynthesis